MLDGSEELAPVPKMLPACVGVIAVLREVGERLMLVPEERRLHGARERGIPSVREPGPFDALLGQAVSYGRHCLRGQ